MPDNSKEKWKIYLRAQDEEDGTKWGSYNLVDPKGYYLYGEINRLFVEEEPVMGLAFLIYVAICWNRIGKNYELINELLPDRILSKIKNPYYVNFHKEGRELTESEMRKLKEELEDFSHEE